MWLVGSLFECALLTSHEVCVTLIEVSQEDIVAWPMERQVRNGRQVPRIENACADLIIVLLSVWVASASDNLWDSWSCIFGEDCGIEVDVSAIEIIGKCDGQERGKPPDDSHQVAELHNGDSHGQLLFLFELFRTQRSMRSLALLRPSTFTCRADSWRNVKEGALLIVLELALARHQYGSFTDIAHETSALWPPIAE